MRADWNAEERRIVAEGARAPDMRTDREYQAAARIISASALARLASRAASAVRLALPDSAPVRAVSTLRRRFDETRPADRVRVAGVILLVANATHAVLVRLEPPLLRPAPLPLLRIDVALLALILIVAAPHVVRAWGRSRLKRLLVRP